MYVSVDNDCNVKRAAIPIRKTVIDVDVRKRSADSNAINCSRQVIDEYKHMILIYLTDCGTQLRATDQWQTLNSPAGRDVVCYWQITVHTSLLQFIYMCCRRTVVVVFDFVYPMANFRAHTGANRMSKSSINKTYV